MLLHVFIKVLMESCQKLRKFVPHLWTFVYVWTQKCTQLTNNNPLIFKHILLQTKTIYTIGVSNIHTSFRLLFTYSNEEIWLQIKYFRNTGRHPGKAESSLYVSISNIAFDEKFIEFKMPNVAILKSIGDKRKSIGIPIVGLRQMQWLCTTTHSLSSYIILAFSLQVISLLIYSSEHNRSISTHSIYLFELASSYNIQHTSRTHIYIELNERA